jgi:hypothetical protein
MNAKKFFSALALTAGSVALIAAATPTNAAPTIVERLAQIEQQGTSKDDGFNTKANHPEFLQQLDGNTTGKDSGIYLKTNRLTFLEALNEQGTSPSDIRARL